MKLSIPRRSGGRRRSETLPKAPRTQVRPGRLLVVAVPLLAAVAVAAVGVSTLRAVQVGGPAYQDVVATKDLAADVGSPRLNLLAAYTVVLQMAATTDPERQDALNARLDALTDDYLGRRDEWLTRLGDDGSGLREQVLETAFAPASRFLATVKRDFQPALRDRPITLTRAREVLDQDLTPLFEEHQAALAAGAELARARIAQTEAQADTQVQQRLRTLALAGLAAVLVAGAAGFLMLRRRGAATALGEGPPQAESTDAALWPGAQEPTEPAQPQPWQAEPVRSEPERSEKVPAWRLAPADPAPAEPPALAGPAPADPAPAESVPVWRLAPAEPTASLATASPPTPSSAVPTVAPPPGPPTLRAPLAPAEPPAPPVPTAPPVGARRVPGRHLPVGVDVQPTHRAAAPERTPVEIRAVLSALQTGRARALPGRAAPAAPPAAAQEAVEAAAPEPIAEAPPWARFEAQGAGS